MKSTTINYGQIPLDPNKLIQFLTTPEAWDKDRVTDVEEWAEAYQLLVTKISNGEFAIPLLNSTEMIGKPNERFESLIPNSYHNLMKVDYRAWYNGWMEGRFDLYGKLMKLGEKK